MNKIISKLKFIPMAMIAVSMVLAVPAHAKKKKKKEKTEESAAISSGKVSGLKLRSIGPAFTSGRISDFAVNPNNPSEYYVAVSSGNVWKTVNNGTTWSAIFEKYGSYAMGVITLDPNNSNVVWLGTGENNHQRVIGYGNGVFKSMDGGKSWKNMGLKESRQIGGIVVDPNDSNVVYVAAEGSIWGPGGERGLYKSVDGGENWEKVLEISEHTGINNIVMDPRDSKVLYATSEQRRRHVHTKIGGGPESKVYKSVDGGKNWKKIMKGLPGGDIGGMGIAISPVNPDVLYLIVEAAERSGGFYRTTNRGETWQKMSSYSSSGQYYNEIFCDPVDVDKVYSTETVTRVTVDGGKTWKRLGNNKRHVDDHAMWIDPKDTNHMLIGGDGGVYETFDGGKHYQFKTNLPITQFYRVAVDDTAPFYWVYGGTQDNNSYGGPNANTSADGVTAGEWVVTLGGDGFWQAIEPGNPNIVYSEYQYGNIYRYDKQSGESIGIKPQPRKGEETYKWNWNTPFILSPHSKTRLYMAANKVFRSDDRGNSWTVISDDITAQIDRDTWPVMGRYWGSEAVVKDVSTSLYGMAVSLDESRVKEGLLVVGTDDGVIQVKDGDNWVKTDKFPGVPAHTYVSDLALDKFDENIIYATFDNMKRDDFKPYVMKSTDKGQTWVSISNNLPENGTVHSIIQDFVDKDLLFVGTEFGVHFSVDGGANWTQLKSGIPHIPVKDITIQEREHDLVMATFGRGFYILDNYSPLRDIDKDFFNKEAHIFPVKKALMYIQDGAKYGQGSMPYYGKNPAFGATFTYFVKEMPKTLKQERKAKEKKLIKDKAPIPQVTVEQMRAEAAEVAPHLIFTIKNDAGEVVRVIKQRAGSGLTRMTWNLRHAGFFGGRSASKFNPFNNSSDGLFVMPGTYTVELDMFAKGEVKHLVDPVSFEVEALANTTLPAKDRAAMVAFQKKTMELYRVVDATEKVAEDMQKRTVALKQAISNTPGVPFELMEKVSKLEKEIADIMWEFNGQRPKASPEEVPPAIPSINDRLGKLLYYQFNTTSDPTQNMRDNYDRIVEKFDPVYAKVKQLMEVDIKVIEAEVEKYGAPYTPGRLPDWK
ncbi:MAG: glycosyl hydrolase [Bacteroidetes bacterium]|nr:glycosyl hydrolase [Bacteroidota bacterium]